MQYVALDYPGDTPWGERGHVSTRARVGRSPTRLHSSLTGAGPGPRERSAVTCVDRAKRGARAHVAHRSAGPGEHRQGEADRPPAGARTRTRRHTLTARRPFRRSADTTRPARRRVNFPCLTRELMEHHSATSATPRRRGSTYLTVCHFLLRTPSRIRVPEFSICHPLNSPNLQLDYVRPRVRPTSFRQLWPESRPGSQARAPYRPGAARRRSRRAADLQAAPIPEDAARPHPPPIPYSSFYRCGTVAAEGMSAEQPHVARPLTCGFVEAGRLAPQPQTQHLTQRQNATLYATSGATGVPIPLIFHYY